MLRPADADVDPTQPAATFDAPLEQLAPPVTLAAPAAAPAAVLPQVHSASPAEQLAPAILTLARTADGSQQMTVRLQPAELGMVQVRIARAVSGTTQIEITAEEPGTLLALQRDQPRLHQTLDEAGIPGAGRTVTYHIAQATQAVQAAAGGNGAGSPAGHAGGHQGPAGRPSAGTTDADGSAAGGRGSYKAREGNTYATSRRSGAPPAASRATAATAAKSYRAGLDIIA